MIIGLHPSVTVMSPEVVIQYLSTNVKEKSKLLKALLTEANNICTSVDLWTAHGKSFIAVSAHWVDIKDLLLIISRDL